MGIVLGACVGGSCVKSVQAPAASVQLRSPARRPKAAWCSVSDALPCLCSYICQQYQLHQTASQPLG